MCCIGEGACVELTEREYSICSTICASSIPLSFSELRKSSEFHQEILSRILRRLQVHQIIEKNEDGRYRRPTGAQCGQ
jgi:DNA-binding HxlR family transcriptional regulator